MLLLAAALYFTFFVPIGRYTLYDHLGRIAATSEAQELTGEVSHTFRGAADTVREHVNDLEAHRAKR